MANIITINQITDLFRQWSKAHPLINDFGVGPTSLIGMSDSMEFPYMWTTFQQNSEVIVTDSNIVPKLSFHVIFMDKTNKIINANRDDNGMDKTDGTEVKSDQFQMVTDFAKFLTQLSQFGAILDGNLNVQSIIDETKEVSSGWMCSFTLKLRFWECLDYINNPQPGPVNPQPTPITCDPVIVKNSNNSYSITIPAGEERIIPDTILTVKDSNGIVIDTINIPATEPYEYTESGICPIFDPVTLNVNNISFKVLQSGDVLNVIVEDQLGNQLPVTLDDVSNKIILDLTQICPLFDDAQVNLNNQLLALLESGDILNLNLIDELGNTIPFTFDNNDITVDLSAVCPVCPVEVVTINVNGTLFETVNAPDTFNVPVKDTDGNLVGSKIGSEWIVPSNQVATALPPTLENQSEDNYNYYLLSIGGNIVKSYDGYNWMHIDKGYGVYNRQISTSNITSFGGDVDVTTINHTTSSFININRYKPTLPSTSSNWEDASVFFGNTTTNRFILSSNSSNTDVCAYSNTVIISDTVNNKGLHGTEDLAISKGLVASQTGSYWYGNLVNSPIKSTGLRALQVVEYYGDYLFTIQLSAIDEYIIQIWNKNGLTTDPFTGSAVFSFNTGVTTNNHLYKITQVGTYIYWYGVDSTIYYVDLTDITNVNSFNTDVGYKVIINNRFTNLSKLIIGSFTSPYPIVSYFDLSGGNTLIQRDTNLIKMSGTAGNLHSGVFIQK
jgi:hypothetical protein